MSRNSSSTVGTPSGREVARRLFAAEYTDATYSYSESDEERAPNYVVTPTGVRINRLFVAGVLTEVSPAGESMLRARIVDPTGAFVVYAGQYQPDAMTFLDSATPPVFVCVTGKARTFSPDDTDVVYTSIRPEMIAEIDSDTRDRWTVSTAKRTLERIATVTGALRSDRSERSGDLTTALRDAGVDPSLAAGVPIAIEQYGTTEAYLADLQRLSLDAVQLVAGEIDAVDELSRSPDEKATDVSFTPVIDPALQPAAPDSKAKPEPSPVDRETVDEPALEDSTETPPEAVSEETDAAFDIEADIDEEFDPEEFELDAEIRNEVESEFGTEFSTAAEVDTSEEPTSEESSADDGIGGESAEPSDSDADAPVASVTDEASDEAATDDATERDVTTVLLETMRDLDDGDGADRDRLIERVSETTGASETAVSDAIQDALMSGQCYEPDDETLKPI
ncbi:hypothetical protein [Halocatena salina]|uniref:Glycerol dehydrogenase n=1 Tax=Halocatena salina TaxID=2934340 RepID=A0A8U0A492_9EURY|nr:hypothetical protein [Halocatena salina]UPM43278.1 hypothetical protein MW046_02245 [Halocatena salina]